MILKTNTKYVFFIIPFIVVLFFFQNCGSGFNAEMSSVEQSSIDSEEETPSIEEEPPPTPLPPAKAYVLPTQVTPLVEGSKMDWTFIETNPAFTSAINGLSTQCESRLADFEATKKIAPIIYDEGLLPGDPKIKEMAPVKASFDKAMNVAFCVYFSSVEEQRSKALAAMIQYLLDWNTTYVGDGNPINERFFTQLFVIADLIFPYLNQNQISAIRSLALRMDDKEVAFMAKLPVTDGRLQNNWKTRHMMIRAHANIIMNRTGRLMAIKDTINADIHKQYTAPVGFTLSKCANLNKVGTYGSHDLQTRDAFIYHISGISELLPFMLLNPTYVNNAAKDKLLKAVTILQPYVLGTKVHPEFQCTTVQYDKDKLVLNPSLGNNWNPESAKVFFRYTRLVWDSTEPWTEGFVTSAYSPWFKVFYTGKGDKL